MRTTKRITWTCEKCRRPINDGAGYIDCDNEEPHQALRDWEDQQRRASEADGGWHMMTRSELGAIPKPAHWAVLHGACDPDTSTSGTYWIGIERIRTLAEVISWTAHLMGKDWFQHTDWDQLLYTVLGQLDPEAIHA